MDLETARKVVELMGYRDYLLKLIDEIKQGEWPPVENAPMDETRLQGLFAKMLPVVQEELKAVVAELRLL